VTIEVTGGVAGTTAALDDLDEAVRRLFEEAGRLAEATAQVAALGAGADLAASAALSPATAAPALEQLASATGPAGLAGEAAALARLAAKVAAAVAAYRATDAAVAEAVELGQDAVLAVAAPALAVGLAAGLPTGAAAQAAGVDVVGGVDRGAFAAPWLIDLAGGAEGLVTALATTPWLMGPLAAGAARAGRPFPPRDYEDALAALAGAASSLSGGHLLAEQGRRHLAEPVATARAGRVLPCDVAGLLAGPDDLSDGGQSRARVVEVPQGDGSSAWIVQLPGTQEWSLAPGDNLADLTSNALLMAQRSTLLGSAVTDALDQSMAAAGRDTGAEPVMLVGHSQGGIAAAALAASPGFRQRHRVTHVVTSGSPIARFPVPADVRVLALEHRQDPVPRLDGVSNPDRVSWVTATRDVAGDREVGGRASRAHDLAEYRQTAAAVDRGTSRSLAEWRRGAAPFFAGDSHGAAVVRDYRLARVLGRS
jgi:hypothetical protein